MSARTREGARNESGGGLSAYFEAMRRFPLLDAEGERDLALAAAAGDARARRRLVEANLRLVVAIARRHEGKGLPLADLVQEGNLGLLRAASRFDPGRGCRFSTYAYRWILQAVTRAVARDAPSQPVPAHIGEGLRALGRVEASLTAHLGRMPSPAELAAELDVSVDHLRLLRRLGRPPLSLEGALLDGLALVERVADPTPVDPCEVACARSVEEVLAQDLPRLSSRERLILHLRYGLDDESPRTYRDIGERLGLSRETVRQIDRNLQARLRAGAASSVTAQQS